MVIVKRGLGGEADQPANGLEVTGVGGERQIGMRNDLKVATPV